MTSFVISLLSLLLSRSPNPEPSRRRKARSILARPSRERIGFRARPRIEVLEDRTLPSAYVVTTTADSGPGSLRDAITQVNADTSHTLYPSPSDSSRDEIDFQVTAASDAAGGGTGFNSATGVATFTPQSAYPTITTAVFINGYTQPGAAPNTLTIGDNATLKIQLDFRALAAVPGGSNGLNFSAEHGTIRGLVLNDFSNRVKSLIQMNASDYHVEGNFIGTDVSGTSVVGGGPGTNGIGMNANGYIIGGTTPDTRNIIAGCGTGIADGGTATLVEGNYIGTDASGTKALGNGYGIASTYPDTIVGNLISGNNTGIAGTRAGAVIQGNLIGTDATGTMGLGNGVGIAVGSGLIGGTTAAARNIISGNGIGLDCNGVATIEGNYIGTNAQGTAAVGNGDGFFIRQGASGLIIGGTASGTGNLISGNGHGIRLHYTTNVQVQGNLIGTDYTGTHAIANYDGIYSQDGAYNNIIGGTSPGAGNVISGNIDFGVNLQHGTGNGNSILGNSIHDNGLGGINLAGGVNNNQAGPALTAAVATGSVTTISGTFHSTPSTTFRLEFFSNMALDTGANHGNAEGQTYLGFVSVTTDSSGNVISSPDGTATVATGIFTTAPGRVMPLPVGQTVLSSTATNLTTGDTSGFSNAVSIPAVGPITAPLAPVAVNSAINVSASFTDAIPSTTHTALWNWGDSSTSAGTVTETNGSGTVTGSHTYTVDGVYTVTLTVTNNLGGSGQSVFQYVVIYNPSAGFVTGGGWITSPTGAYAANPNLTGQANFGLNAKYKSGATVPTGNTDFQFPAANLTFQSTSYDWLVITTNQAQYQGSGTINGAGNYGFLVTALDGGGHGADLFRLKIWDKNHNNAVVYDTQPGAATTAAPTTALGGGRIQVHTNAQLVAGGANPNVGDVVPLTREELQPVVQEAIARWEAAGIDAGQLSALSQVTVGIAALPGPWLGMAFPGTIWIDQSAAGYGWYIDPSPASDSAFPAAPGSPAYGKVDLLTVVEHELGHELGFEDTTGDDLMGVFLAPGVRRVPALDQAPVNTPEEGFVPPASSPTPATLPARGAVVGSDVLAALVETPLDKVGAVSPVAFAPSAEAPVLPALAPVLLTVENKGGDGTAPTSSGQQDVNVVSALDTVFASNQDLLLPELA
jgi:hypothetical protein